MKSRIRNKSFVVLTIILIFILQKMRIIVMPDQLIAAGGERVPCALCDLISIGKLGPDENKVISKALGEFISNKLSVDIGKSVVA